MTHRGADTGVKTSSSTETQTTSWGAPSTRSFVSYSRRQWFTGENLPHYHARKRRGELLPHTSFDRGESDFTFSPGFLDVKLKSNPNTWYKITNWEGATFGTGGGYRHRDIDRDDLLNVYSIGVPPSDMRYFTQQAASRIASQGWDALTFAGEIPSLRRQFKGISKRLLRLARGKDSKQLYRLWLEGRYGWRTLAYDIRDFDQAINEYDVKRTRYSERAGTSTSWSDTRSFNLNANDYSATMTKSETMDHSFRGFVTGDIKPARFIVDPLKTGWELVPYSFVVDWVYGVGVALDAVKFLRMSSGYSASLGIKTDYTINCSSSITDSETRTATGDSGSCSGSSMKISRVPTSISTIPQITGRALTPDLGLDLQALQRVRSKLY